MMVVLFGLANMHRAHHLHLRHLVVIHVVHGGGGHRVDVVVVDVVVVAAATAARHGILHFEVVAAAAAVGCFAMARAGDNVDVVAAAITTSVAAIVITSTGFLRLA